MEITLTPIEQELARRIAVLRNEVNRSRGHTINVRRPQDHNKNDMDGMGAELAVARALNVYPDLDVEDAQAEDLLFHGYSIDVKQTHHPKGKLLLGFEKTKFCDFYCLVTGEMPTYKIVGFASLGKLRHPDSVINLGYGDTYGLDQDRLASLDLFVNTVRELRGIEI